MQENTILHYLGIESSVISRREKIVSALGGFVAILCVFYTSTQVVGIEEAVCIVPSIGASAVLLFAVPHSALGQVWNVVGGHLISAAIGVACFQLIPTLGIAAASSVGLAIAAMYYARCIHPPGGATALAAVVAGPHVHALGFLYILVPVAINVGVILILAFLFNAPFKWRRYPAFLASKEALEVPSRDAYGPVDHANLVYALSQIDTFIDVSEEDLLRIYKLATGRKVSANNDTDSTG